MLEDFFTLTEMKDGISTTGRIEELISEIQKLEDAVDFNTADSIRQCSTAASMLASTKNEECLQHFVQLNGLRFLNQWLQGAQNCCKDSSNSAEDLIDAILAAIERLPVDNEQPTSYGIKPTVEQLLTHGNIKINQKAGMLCQKWSGALNDGVDCQQKAKEETCETDQENPPTASQATENDRQDGASEAATMEAKAAPSVMTCLEVPPSDPSTNENTHITNQPPQLTSPNYSDGNTPLGDVNSSGTSLGSHGCLENVSATEENSASNDVGVAPNGVLHSNSHSIKSDAEHAASVDATVDAESLRANKLENSLVDSKMDMEDRNVSSNFDIRKDESFPADIPQSQAGTAEAVNPVAIVNHALQDSSKEKSMHKEDGPTSSSQKKKTALVDSDSKGIQREIRLKKNKGMKAVSLGGSSKVLETKVTPLSREKSEPLTDYDDTDALEVARLVAIEVEREVIDYREPFCSSSPEINSGDTGHAASPDLEVPQQSEPPTEEMNDDKSSDTVEDSGSSSSVKEDGSGITDDSGPFSRKHAWDSDAEPYVLDLNANQCTVEIDCSLKPDPNNSVNLSTPIAVAASRGASTFPARLHFEGELGWKGSAATSAFRPASPWRTPEGEKTLSASSQKTSNLVFDLNVAENEDAAAAEPLSTGILPTSSGIASVDTSATVGLRTGRGLELDLNCPCEEEAASVTNSVSLFWNRQPYNGDQSQPSSSSSSRQPAVRNFDLNDNGSIFDGSSSQGIDESSVKTSGKDVSDHPAVTILGTRITLGHKDYHKQNQHSFLGPNMESRISARSMPPYAHMPPPNYGVISYPTGSAAMPFPPTFYAPGGVPYMVDAKGDPVVPPMTGLGLNISHPSFASRTSAPSSNEFSYYRPSMDLNYGLSSTEAARKEGGSFKPVSFQGHTVFIDEHMRNMSQGGSSGVLLKRKEPDSSWDPYSRR